MPRGKYVNHKGRSRHFTSPEELQQEKDESSEEQSSEEEEEGDDDDAAGTSKGARAKPKPRAKKTDSNSDSSNESSEEEEDRDARKGVASLIEIENPNRVVKKATKKVANLSLDDGEPTKPELTRREREQIEKQKARQKYEKLHAAGKTTEAKADLARLALIRQQREEARLKREAEKAAAEAKKASS